MVENREWKHLLLLCETLGGCGGGEDVAWGNLFYKYLHFHKKKLSMMDLGIKFGGIQSCGRGGGGV